MQTPQQITISNATASDSLEIILLYKQLWQNWPLFDAQKFQSIFQNDLKISRKTYLTARKSGKIVGICALAIKDSFHYLKTAEIEEIIVDENCRSQGIGKMLLDKASEVAKDCGCYRITLHSNEKRTDAHRFYEANGFEKSPYFFTKKL